MNTILVHAQASVYALLDLMPTAYQRDSLQALLGLFLEAQGHPLPQHCQVKSAGALSRFLNVYGWSIDSANNSGRASTVVSATVRLLSSRATTLVAADCGPDEFGEMRQIQGVWAFDSCPARKTGCTYCGALPGHGPVSSPVLYFHNFGLFPDFGDLTSNATLWDS